MIDYLQAIERNEVKDFFLGKGDYFEITESGERYYGGLNYDYCIKKIGEQNLYDRLSNDYIDILKDNNVTSQEFYDLLMYVIIYYGSYNQHTNLSEWIYPEELTELFNTNYKRLKGEADVSKIDKLLLDLKQYNNVDLLNYDRINVIGSKTVLPRVPKSTEGVYIVPDGIVRIPAYAFIECDKIISVIMPDTVESIGEYTFAGCVSLKNIKLSENLKFIGISAFSKGSDIGYSEIPACSLERIYIPKKVKWILDSYTFDGCFSLKKIEVDAENPYYLSFDDILYTKDMKEMIFCPRIGKKTVRIPSTVKILPHNAVEQCKDLETIYIPESVNEIDICFLEGCSNVKEVHFGIKEDIQKIVPKYMIDDVARGCLFYVPKGTKQIYQSHCSLKEQNIIEEDDWK